MKSLSEGARAVVIGASGGLGGAFLEALEASDGIGEVRAFARRPIRADMGVIDVEDERSIEAAASDVALGGAVDLVIVATGVLHDAEGLAPEKALRQLTGASLSRAFAVNTIGPALVAKHFAPLLRRDHKAVLAVLSARVGSIEDNRLGGWYAYRASKAALNQLIKTTAVELARRWPHAVCCALHPGTVDTALSAPFQGNVRPGKLFEPSFAAGHLLAVLDRLGADDSGGLFAWDGERLPF